MAKIIIGKKTQKGGYFEIEYTFNLDTPQAVQDSMAKVTSNLSARVSTVVSDVPAVDNSVTIISGVAGYSDGAVIEDIQADLINRFNKAQDDLNNDDSASWEGLSWDGSVWA